MTEISVSGSAPAGRTFLVGCPRSGTTLLQGLLSAHPAVISFPETFFFQRVVSPNRWLRACGLASSSAPSALRDLERLGIPPAPGARSRALPKLTVAQYARSFTGALDASAHRAGRAAWVEKTPSHLLRVADIERHVRGCGFVHMIRSGTAVVASLYEVTRDHPEVWGGARTVDQCLRRWRRDLRLSRTCVGREHHVFVSYERLTKAPTRVLERLCEFLELPAEVSAMQAILRDYGERASEVGGQEPWKATVGEPIANRNAGKLANFTQEQRALIERSVAEDDRLMEGFPFL